MCVSGFPCPDPKHFIVNFEENIVKYAEKCSENISIK